VKTSGENMSAEAKPSPEAIRLARAENPKMRERDLATQLGVSEADLVAAHVGEGVRRIEPRVSDVLFGLEALGEVMALTRNESAVHEKIGVYDKVIAGQRAMGPWLCGGEKRRRDRASQPSVLRQGR
jgi:putative hemin transport protein